jgi:NAD(P)-dependent dehydrogenase (short-subunit alcohol dehydrogenase family)
MGRKNQISETEHPEMTVFSLKGRCAMVTGAGSGLGRSFSKALAMAGAQIICVDRDLEAAETTADSIRLDSGSALALFADIGDNESVQRLWSQVAERDLRVDVLINNAGIATVPARVHETDVADWDRLMAVNLRGVFLCTKAAVAAMMRAQIGGSVINIGSIAGLAGLYPGFACWGTNYAVSKAALVGLTRQCAIEYAADGIRFNLVAPGWHSGTNLGAERRQAASPQQLAAFDEAITSRLPIGRRGVPEDLDGLVIYLASGASSYVTGQIIAADGGWTAA